MQTGDPMVRHPHSIRLARGLMISAALLVAGCATSSDAAGGLKDTVRTTGIVASIDIQPWTYDGNAVVQVETADRDRVQVQLPARWNLCQAAPVDVEALAVDMRVTFAGAASGDDAVVVCADPSHHLMPAGGT